MIVGMAGRSNELSQPIRMVAIDVDGTLLDSRKRLGAGTVEAVQAVTEAGVKVVLASARPPRSLDAIHAQLGLKTPTINYNGALVWDPTSDKVLVHRPVEAGLARQVAELARTVDEGVVVSVEVLDQWHTDRVDPALATETAKTHAPDRIAPLDELFDQPVTKLMLLAPPERLAVIHGAVTEAFAEQVGLMVSDAHLLQVVEAGVDKAAAAAWVAKQYGLPAGAVMAIGDAPNDAAMLRWAGLGAAVGNGWDQAIDAADVIGPGHDEDGVAKLLCEWVLSGADKKAAEKRISAAG